MTSFIKKTVSEFFYGIFASFVLFSAMFLFVLLILLPFIGAFLINYSNPGIHPIFVFGSVFVIAFIEFILLSFIEYDEY